MKVRKSFNFSTFQDLAKADVEGFDSYGKTVSFGKEEGETYVYCDNGSNVLGVAHLDTVQSKACATMLDVKGENVIVCPVLDDRLGVYIITHMLPKLGIMCDWLLTTGEEIGRSSAELFEPEKDYNWAFSFDRCGTDAVLYHYDHKKLRTELEQFGLRIGQGTFSDLSFLDIGCSGVNIGCGYHNEHSQHAYAILSETFSQVGKFRKLWSAYKDKRLPYAPYTENYERRAWWKDSVYSGYGHNGYCKTSWKDIDPYSREYVDQYINSGESFPDWEPSIDYMSDQERLEQLADEAIDNL